LLPRCHLGFRFPVLARGRGPHPKETEAAFDPKKFDKQSETLRQLVDESMELSRNLETDRKHGRTASKKTLTRLQELHLQIQILEKQQTEEMRKLLVAQDAETKAAETKAAEVPAKEAPDDPSDLYFQGWLLSRDAGKLKPEGKLAESREKLEKAQELFERVAKEQPDWKPQMVQARLKRTKEELAALPASDE
jgi:hypothetical protein